MRDNIPPKKRTKDIIWGKPRNSPPYARKRHHWSCLSGKVWYLFSMHELRTLSPV